LERECDETKQYLQETFEIHETDEDNYNDNQQKNVKTPQFYQPDSDTTLMQKKILKKYSKKHSNKVKRVP
jgi:hypothetical protein